MIEHVSIASSTYQQAPFRFEAGTPNIAGCVGLGAAFDYIAKLPMETLIQHEAELVGKALSGLKQIPASAGGRARKSSVCDLVLVRRQPPERCRYPSRPAGIAVRSGNHCNMTLMTRLGIPGTVRASFSLYNNEDDVDALINGVAKAATFL